MRGFLKIWLSLVALLTALCGLVPGAFAQTITNIASANWYEQDSPRSVRSNPVAIDVLSDPATIETYKRIPGAGQSLAFTPSHCGEAELAVPGGLSSDGTVASLERTTSLRIGDTLFFRVSAPAANLDPAKIDSLTATLVTASGDRETLTIFETAPNSATFVGAIPTTAVPPQPVQGDCRLSVAAGDHISIECSRSGTAHVIATAQIEVLADPFGLVFASEDGTPVEGVRVSLVDAVTGLPAKVYADDGVTTWPSSVVTGAIVIDGAGNSHAMLPGEYRFPLAPLGTYRILVEPPAPYTAPSQATPAALSALHRPDGSALEISAASYGGSLILASPAPVRVDIPLDHPSSPVALTKTASRASALPGDTVFFTVTVRNSDAVGTKHSIVLVDQPAAGLRIRKTSLRINGQPAGDAASFAADGRTFTLAMGDLAPGASRTVTYAMTIAADAPAGQLVNKVSATDQQGRSALASAAVKVEREDLVARMTLVGQITDGGCELGNPHHGIAGVRVVLEDGSFAITDADGRYHFEGLVPGSHVVQALTATLPKSGQFVDCARSTRSAGSASSRFVEGQGGSLVVADFAAILPEGAPVEAAVAEPDSKAPDQDDAARAAAGAGTDWLALGNGPTAFLFPAIDHNPRAPAVRVVIRHRVTEKVELLVDGKPVDPVAFDGTRSAPGGTHSVSLWRGIPLDGDVTHLTAIVRNEQGAIVGKLTRDVYFSSAAARVELVPDQSVLIADGTTKPVLALRILDRNGRPVHAGLTGELSISAPYESADALDAMQSRALSGLGRAAPRWFVKGDDGIAYVALAPTMVSGKLHLEFNFAEGQQRRRQELDTWIAPGKQPWTIAGLVEGRGGAIDIADAMGKTGTFASDLGRHGRIAFYAKGPILGRLIATVAYDSAKQRDDQRLLGALDPAAYYTVFADGSDRRFDAASREKVYARVEGKGLTALYGDFDSGFDQTQLARYQRTATGFKGEFTNGSLHAQGFAARVASSHQHDEFQGGGISGPYRLSNRAIIANSEVVSLEVRDRYRSEVIVSRQALVRFVDYDIDPLSGTITFKQPVLSRDEALNPRFIVIDYEVDETARGGKITAGLRTDYTTKDGTLRIGASLVTDNAADGASGSPARRYLAAVDLRARIGSQTELRAETALTFNQGQVVHAWLVELEHHSARLDLTAYARLAESGFGLGQTTLAELGRRKFGIDAQYRVSESLGLTASAWHDDSLTDPAQRTAIQFGALYHTQKTDWRLGVATMRDTLAAGTSANSTVLEFGMTHRLLDNKLELTGASSLALGPAKSVDLPQRHQLGLRYAITPDVRFVANYEIAKGESLNARTARAGFEITPWNGAKLAPTLGQQEISEYGKRSFAAFGLAQSLALSQHLTIDLTLDSSQTIGGINPAQLINPAHPASSGGNLGGGDTYGEDFTALTLGGNWRDGRWSVSARGEWRDGQMSNRKGLTFGAIRQIGEGSMLGGGFTWTKATAQDGAMSKVFDGSLAFAYRPAKSSLASLAKLEFRSDQVENANLQSSGAVAASAFTVSGNAKSQRLIGSVSLDWSPRERLGEQFVQRSEVSAFVAARYNFDSVEGFDLSGTTLFGGLNARLGLSEHFDLGASLTVRTNLSDHTTSFSYGPQISFNPANDMLLTLGYNISGYRDRDFSAAENTDKGLYVAVKFKFDAGTFGFLGLNGR
ncbi:hypothetical protein [Novosphingobium sp.]|uniref:hypothetical protein n=1 Tax=Novosphingobium sp. TaxID=1874826 RepID=UPI0035B29536